MSFFLREKNQFERKPNLAWLNRRVNPVITKSKLVSRKIGGGIFVMLQC